MSIIKPRVTVLALLLLYIFLTRAPVSLLQTPHLLPRVSEFPRTSRIVTPPPPHMLIYPVSKTAEAVEKVDAEPIGAPKQVQTLRKLFRNTIKPRVLGV